MELEHGQDAIGNKLYGCRYCRFGSDQEACSEIGPSGYRCTQRPEHDGDHRACGTGKDQHPIAQWEEYVMDPLPPPDFLGSREEQKLEDIKTFGSAMDSVWVTVVLMLLWLGSGFSLGWFIVLLVVRGIMVVIVRAWLLAQEKKLDQP
jgi:hypothetical protein